MFVWTFSGVLEAIWLGIIILFGTIWGIAHLISSVRKWFSKDESHNR